MKKLIPYILAYLIVAAATAVYAQLFSHTPASLVPPNSVTVITTLPQDQLVAKLHEAGLQQAQLRTMTVRPAPFLTLTIHFVFYAVVLAAFAVLVHIFQRTFRADISVRDHAA